MDDASIDLELLKEIKLVRLERISEYVWLKGAGTYFVEQGTVREVPCDVALPSATQNELKWK